VIEVTLEQRRAGADPAAAELGWEAVPGAPTALTASPGPGATTLWTGVITLPAGDGPFRLVIKEFEAFGASGRRLVYANAVVL